jgi:hypothetical protein
MKNKQREIMENEILLIWESYNKLPLKLLLLVAEEEPSQIIINKQRWMTTRRIVQCFAQIIKSCFIEAILFLISIPESFHVDHEISENSFSLHA